MIADIAVPPRRRRIGAGLALLGVVALGAGVGTAVGRLNHRGAPPAGKQADGLVGYPSFLPKDTLHVRTDALLVGTAARPAVASQGDPVLVETPHFSVHAVVTGPEVPGEGLPFQAPTTTCTFEVTLSRATAAVPISLADFDTIDASGTVYRPFFVPGSPVPPAQLLPGHTVSFELRTGEAVGEGLMRWAPVGGRIVAKWDFVVEND